LPAKARRLPGNGRGRYDWQHDLRRRALVPVVATGEVACARCGELIAPGDRWDLGHDDADPRYYTGPEHSRCNRQTGLHYAERKVSRQWL
jgi:hypothetical protein